ncbi:hypothetical protein BKA56DRAFT_506579 [Ilyonectria sp. MPI-CAGE-AT-0026]|nr:hypothetical protein BKA56DRAFT_506579 [Ilyonectria sp. MPI-CAGE-AT-0026]
MWKTKLIFGQNSCELCRVRKVKCDRAKPSCSWCLRHNRPCVYRERRRPGGGILKSHDLEIKMSRLDALVHDIWARVEDHILKHDTSHQGFRSPAIRSPEPLDVPYTTNLPSESSYFLHSDQEPSTLTSDPDLPPSDLLYALVDLFFKHINTWCPLLDRKATFGIYFGSTPVTQGDRVVLHAIIATTLRFSDDPRLTPIVRERFHNVSRKTVESYALENINLYALKALTLLSLDMLGMSNGLPGWVPLALITRTVLHLDLCIEKKGYLSERALPHESSSLTVGLSQPESWFEDEGRRRLCWVIYILDRYAAVATPYKFMLAEEEMRRCLPCRYDLWLAGVAVETRSFNWIDGKQTEYAMNSPENLGSFSYHCEVLRILSRIDNFLKHPIAISSEGDIRVWRHTFISLETELGSWLHNLPGDYGNVSLLCHSDPGARVINWIMLHAAFVTSTIRLNSVAAYPVVQSTMFVPSYRAMQTCLSAVDSLQRIAQDVLDINGLYLLGPHFAFSLWVSGRLLVLHAATLRSEISLKIDFFITMLAQMGRYWEVASEYSALLNRVVENSRRGDKTLAEMRQCAYKVVTTSESTRLSTLEPTWTRETSSDERNYVDVFDFFNYPRLKRAATITPHSLRYDSGDRPPVNAACSMDFSAPSPEQDWLVFDAPQDGISSGHSDQAI